jgi:tRNA-Thr(GGU) m(6)t(6)A37 methyltransferase TsaA
MQTFSYSPIGTVHSCFKDKFGIPRQSGLAPHATATLELFSPYNREEAWAGIESFSHLWIIFSFHQNIESNSKLSVRPPRLGGEKKLGVFATRSPFHPNFLGQSIVKLEKVQSEKGKISLTISNHDLLDQTPIVDIKPYIPQYDYIPKAANGWIEHKSFKKIEVKFCSAALNFLQQNNAPDNLQLLIEEILSLDPRAGYQKKKHEQQIYRIQLYDIDVEWQFIENRIEVLSLYHL